jgi:tetratricopeptide (TPR) repeat protein
VISANTIKQAILDFRPLTAVKLALLITLMGILNLSYAQDNQEHMFAFVQNIKGKSAMAAPKQYKYRVAREVFDKLLQARGDFRQAAPGFIMNNGEQFVAWMNPKEVQIGIEEKAYDICIGFGADSINALAALISHELVHYFEKHDWNRHFATQNKELETTKKIDDLALSEGIKHEAQADYLGGFLAHTAGYQVTGLMPQLLAKVYAAYQLPSQISGYPSLEDRVAISRNTMEQLKQLVVVYETAGLLSLTGQYADASRYYQHILKDFPSREIYNNAGVNLLLAASLYFSPQEMPFLLPLELDAQSRLFGQKSVDPERQQTREDLLKEAIRYLDQALLLDPTYPPAYLNKAVAFILINQPDDAEYVVRKGRKASPEFNHADFKVAEGLIAHLRAEPEAVLRHFKEAAEMGSAIASFNLNVLKGLPETNASPPRRGGVDKIESILLDHFLTSPEFDLEIDLGKGLYNYEKRFENSRILIHSADLNRRYAFFHLCEAGCTDKTRFDSGIGSHLKDLILSHGISTKLLSLTDGQFIVYPLHNLFYRLDLNQNVISWGAYRLSDY